MSFNAQNKVSFFMNLISQNNSASFVPVIKIDDSDDMKEMYSENLHNNLMSQFNDTFMKSNQINQLDVLNNNVIISNNHTDLPASIDSIDLIDSINLSNDILMNQSNQLFSSESVTQQVSKAYQEESKNQIIKEESNEDELNQTQSDNIYNQIQELKQVFDNQINEYKQLNIINTDIIIDDDLVVGLPNNNTDINKISEISQNIINKRIVLIDEYIIQINTLSVKINELLNTKKLFDDTYSKLINVLITKKNEINKITSEIEILSNQPIKTNQIKQLTQYVNNSVNTNQLAKQVETNTSQNMSSQINKNTEFENNTKTDEINETKQNKPIEVHQLDIRLIANRRGRR